MSRSVRLWPVLLTGLAVALIVPHVAATNPNEDFGSFVQKQLNAHAGQLFGFRHPLAESALGPYDGPDNLAAIQVAPGLRVSLVSSAVASAADQIAFWPDDINPRYVFVCDEETTDPAVQRVDLRRPANANATTIVKGLVSCDPVRLTPWGTIIVAEESDDGGLYELIDPANITNVISVTDRAKGTTTDATHLVKRQAVGALAFEGLALQSDGTMIYGDENFPSGGNGGGAIFKFVPAIPFSGGGPVTVPAQSPLASGAIFGLRVAASGSTRWGQGAETGNGRWVAVTAAPDTAGNINLRAAALAQRFTGFYRPEDMEIDPLAADKGEFRACWANTGRKSHTANSLVEDSAVQSEIMCLTENPPSTFDPNPPTGTIPVVDRFLTGSEERAMYDNVAFQPRSGNLVVLEDGPVDVVTTLNPRTTELRGNDLWICLPDGKDDDTLSDGCVRFASIRDTTAEPSGFIFFGSGESALVHIQHRAANDRLGEADHGALVKISGFRVRDRREFDEDDEQ